LKKIQSMNKYLFDIAAGTIIFELLAQVGIIAAVVALIVVAIVLIVRASKKRRAAAQAAAKPVDAEKGD